MTEPKYDDRMCPGGHGREPPTYRRLCSVCRERDAFIAGAEAMKVAVKKYIEELGRGGPYLEAIDRINLEYLKELQ